MRRRKQWCRWLSPENERWWNLYYTTVAGSSTASRFVRFALVVTPAAAAVAVAVVVNIAYLLLVAMQSTATSQIALLDSAHLLQKHVTALDAIFDQNPKFIFMKKKIVWSLRVWLKIYFSFFFLEDYLFIIIIINVIIIIVCFVFFFFTFFEELKKSWLDSIVLGLAKYWECRWGLS